jgi:hypothetical protein
MVQLSKDDEDDMKVKALEFVAQRGQEVWVKVSGCREAWVVWLDRRVLAVQAGATATCMLLPRGGHVPKCFHSNPWVSLWSSRR